MRQVWIFDDAGQAGACGDYLAGLQIPNSIMDEDDGRFGCWVHSQDDVERAEGAVQEFLRDPQSEAVKQVRQQARRIRKEEKREAKRATEYRDVRTTVFHSPAYARGAFTMLLVALSLVVFVFSGFGREFERVGFLAITRIVVRENGYSVSTLWSTLQQGEVWRLFTPMLVHMDFLHVLFNMMWLLDLGSMVEDRKGTFFILLFILLTSAASNLAQYYTSGPFFGGMSGVNYALFGYIWMKGRFDRSAGLSLHKTTVVSLIVWYFICLLGLVGSIANTAHTVGLLSGMAWGILSSPGWWRFFSRIKRR